MAIIKRQNTIAKELQNRYSHAMKTLLLCALLASASLVSCTSGPNAQTGTVLGALGGAAAGGIIGNQSGRGLEGAAIGAGLGAVGGNMIGGAQDQRNAEYDNRNYDRGYRQNYDRGYYDRGYNDRGYYRRNY